MKIRDMVAENSKLQGTLNKENADYYGDMVVFLRTSQIDNHKIEELLLEILDHLRQAQEDGYTADAVFGSDPITYCKELVAEIPKRSVLKHWLFDYIWVPWSALTVNMSWQSITNFLTNRTAIYVVSTMQLLWLAVSAVLVVRLLRMVVHHIPFQSRSKKRAAARWLGVILIGSFWADVGIASVSHSHLPIFHLSPWAGLAISGFGVLIAWISSSPLGIES